MPLDIRKRRRRNERYKKFSYEERAYLPWRPMTARGRDDFRLARVMLVAPGNLISACLAPIVTAVIEEELCWCAAIVPVVCKQSFRRVRSAKQPRLRDRIVLILRLSNDNTHTVKDDNGR